MSYKNVFFNKMYTETWIN